jgi:hypothetical protein
MEKAQLEYIKTQRDGQNVKRTTAAQRAKGELSKEWGGETSSRIAMANRAFKEHAGRDASVLAQLELNDGPRFLPIRHSSACWPMSAHPRRRGAAAAGRQRRRSNG